MRFRRAIAVVTILMVLIPAASASAQQNGDGPPNETDPTTIRTRWGFGLMGLAGLTLIGVGVVAVRAGDVQDDLDEWRQMVPMGLNSCTFASSVKGTSGDSEEAARARESCDRADRLDRALWSLLGVWAASLGVGLGLVLHSVLSDDDATGERARVDLLPSVGPQGGGLHLRWRY